MWRSGAYTRLSRPKLLSQKRGPPQNREPSPSHRSVPNWCMFVTEPNGFIDITNCLNMLSPVHRGRTQDRAGEPLRTCLGSLKILPFYSRHRRPLKSISFSSYSPFGEKDTVSDHEICFYTGEGDGPRWSPRLSDRLIPLLDPRPSSLQVLGGHPL